MAFAFYAGENSNYADADVFAVLYKADGEIFAAGNYVPFAHVACHAAHKAYIEVWKRINHAHLDAARGNNLYLALQQYAVVAAIGGDAAARRFGA